LNSKEFSRVQRKLEKVLDEQTLTAVARASGFTKRVRTVAPMSLVVAVLVALGTRKTESIADIV